MVKLITGCSPILVAATVTLAAAGGQAPSPASAPSQITAVGCVTRNGVVDVNKGTRLLNMDPNGLALTAARVTGTGGNRSSAVPGSLPEGRDTGTIPNQTIVGGRSEQPDTVAFALTGEQVKALGSYVGRRVEVVGRVVSRVDQSAPPRGTTGAVRDAAPVPGVGTREERPAEPSAHPSAELQKLEVVSFRGATGGCQ